MWEHLKETNKWNTRAGGSSLCCCPMSRYCVVIKTCSGWRKFTDNSNWQHKSEKGTQTIERKFAISNPTQSGSSSTEPTVDNILSFCLFFSVILENKPEALKYAQSTATTNNQQVTLSPVWAGLKYDQPELERASPCSHRQICPGVMCHPPSWQWQKGASRAEASQGAATEVANRTWCL